MAQLYRKKGTQPMLPWSESTDMTGVSISDEDMQNGSPKPGDMIAFNPDNKEDRWLVAEAYFRKNYELAPPDHPRGLRGWRFTQIFAKVKSCSSS